MLVRFNPPPGWPLPPGWTPPEGWDPDPSWPAPPPGWQFWVEVPGAAGPDGPPPRRRRAVAGAVVGAVLLAVVLVLGIRQLVTGPTEPPTQATPPTSTTQQDPTTDATTESTEPTETEPGETETYTVTHPTTGLLSAEVGACTTTEYLQDDTLQTLPLLDCAEPHDAEVFALFDLADAEAFPGADAVREQAIAGCQEAFEPYVGSTPADSELAIRYIAPVEGTWDNGDREVICIAYLAGVEETGSWAGTGR